MGSASPGANRNFASRTASLVCESHSATDTHLGDADTFETLQVYCTFLSPTLGRGNGPTNDPFGLIGELAPDPVSCLIDEDGKPACAIVCLTKLHVPQGSPGPRADSAWTLNLIVVRGEKSETIIA